MRFVVVGVGVDILVELLVAARVLQDLVTTEGLRLTVSSTLTETEVLLLMSVFRSTRRLETNNSTNNTTQRAMMA